MARSVAHREAGFGSLTLEMDRSDQAEFDWVAAAYEDDRDRRSRRLGRNCRGGVTRSDYCYLAAYQIGCEIGQLIVLVLRPAILDCHILAFDVAGFTNALPECSQKECTIGRPRAAEEAEHRQRWLLRARRERPHCRRAAEQRDELAPSHVGHGGVLPPLCANEAHPGYHGAGDRSLGNI